MEDLFNVNANVATPGNSENSNSIEWKPSFRKSKDHVYTAFIRFIPNWQAPQTESMVSKYTVWLENPQTHEKKELDDPRSVNEPSIFTQAFFDLRNANRTEDSKKVSSRMKYASIIQLIDTNCESEKSQIGALKVWRFPDTIAKLINEQTNPSNSMEKAISPYNLLEARYLFVKITERAGYNDYSQCKFYTSEDDRTKAQCPIQTATGIQMLPINATNIQNEQFRAAVNQWLQAGPNLNDYKYKPMTDADRDWAFETINLIRQGVSTPQVQSGVYSAPVFGQTPAAKPVVDSFGLNAGPVNAQPAPQAAPAMPQFTAAPSAVPQATTPGGFAASNVPDLSDVLGGVASPSAPAPQAAPAPSSAPGGGLQLGDVLGEII